MSRNDEEKIRVDEQDVRRLVDAAAPVAERLRGEGKVFDAAVIDGLVCLAGIVVGGLALAAVSAGDEEEEGERLERQQRERLKKERRPRAPRSKAPARGVSAGDEPEQVSHAQSATDHTKTWCGLGLVGGEDGRGQLRAHEFLIDSVEPGPAQAGLLAGMATACRLCVSNARFAGILIDVEPGDVEPSSEGGK